MPNLSIEKIAGALAVLGTSLAISACGGSNTPVNAPVSSTETAAPGAEAAKAGDGHCGAGKEHKAGDNGCGGAAKPDTTAASTTPASATPTAAAAPAAATPAPASVPDTKAAAAATDPPKKSDPKKAAAPPAPAKKAGAAASCGAGTCSAKK